MIFLMVIYVFYFFYAIIIIIILKKYGGILLLMNDKFKEMVNKYIGAGYKIKYSDYTSVVMCPEMKFPALSTFVLLLIFFPLAIISLLEFYHNLKREVTFNLLTDDTILVSGFTLEKKKKDTVKEIIYPIIAIFILLILLISIIIIFR
jgi:hypothetical protein